MQKHEIQRLLDEALAKLDEKHRLVFLLRDVEGLSVKETAEALGLSEANTKVRLLRARLQLREHLTRSLGDPATRVIRTRPCALNCNHLSTGAPASCRRVQVHHARRAGRMPAPRRFTGGRQNL